MQCELSHVSFNTWHKLRGGIFGSSLGNKQNVMEEEQFSKHYWTL